MVSVGQAKVPVLARLRLAAVEDAGGGCLRLVCEPAPLAPPQPGQFYMLRGDWHADPLLPRPFSVARWRRVGAQDVQLEFLLKVVGRGTRLLAEARPGDELTALGPLGVGFDGPPGPVAWMVAGGIGIAPFPALVDEIAVQERKLSLLIGARTQAEVPGVGDFEGRLVGGVHVATDDGSEGFAGTVVGLLAERLGTAVVRPSVVYVCGPQRMMEAAAATCRGAGVSCVVALEAPMACGMGTCRGCVIRTHEGENFTVCTQGPVADAAYIWGEASGS